MNGGSPEGPERSERAAERLDAPFPAAHAASHMLEPGQVRRAESKLDDPMTELVIAGVPREGRIESSRHGADTVHGMTDFPT